MKRAPSEYDFLDFSPTLPAPLIRQRMESLLESVGFEFLREENDGGFLYQVPNKGCVRAHYGRKAYRDPDICVREADCLIYYDGLDETIKEQIRHNLREAFDDERVRAA